MSKKKRNPGGRRNKYVTHVEPRFAEIEIWLRDGLSEEQVFKNLGVSKTSWHNYKNQHSELVDLLKKGRQTQITEVENALYKNATGFYYFVEEKAKVKDADGNEHLEKITLRKFKAPETGAIAFYLKNKDKENYTDNPQLVDIKREELELRRELAKFNDW